MKNNISIYEALDNLTKAMTTLCEVWLGENQEGIDLNELEANELYPFGESFDELTFKALDWVYATKEEIQRTR